MKKAIAILALAIIVTVPAAAEEAVYEIQIENPINKNRVDQPVVLEIAQLLPGFEVSRAILSDGGKEIPCQLDDLDRDGKIDEIAFVVDIDAKKQRKLKLLLSDTGEQPVYTPRVWAGYALRGRKKDEIVPVREVKVDGDVNFYNQVHGHGPMFESELVGYRVYFNQKQTLDPYGKFTYRLELADTRFYPTDEHLAKGYGDDVLLAGNSCGIGAFKGWDDNKTTHIEPVATRAVRLVSEGPVRTIVEIEARGWKYRGKTLNLTNRYTLYAGHRDVKVDAMFDKPLENELFSTGVILIPGNETLTFTDHEGLVGVWGTNWPVNDTVKYAKETIGAATYVPRDNVYGERSDGDNLLYVISAPDEQCLSYYTMFTSRKEKEGCSTAEAWFASLPAWKEELEHPVSVKVKNKK